MWLKNYSEIKFGYFCGPFHQNLNQKPTPQYCHEIMNLEIISTLKYK